MNNEFYRCITHIEFSNPALEARTHVDHRDLPYLIWLGDNLEYLVTPNYNILSTLYSFNIYLRDKDKYADSYTYLIKELFWSHHPIQGIQDFIPVYAHKDVQDSLDLIYKGCSASMHAPSHLPLVQTKFLKDLDALDFHDYRTYPVRVYWIANYEDQFIPERTVYEKNRSIPGRYTRAEAEQRFEYSDDRFVFLQLTQPALEFFKPPQLLVSQEIVSWLEFIDSFQIKSLPVLFRVNYHLAELFFNADAKNVLEKYKSLRFISGSGYFQNSIGSERVFAP
jgi:hypothetical protein